MTPHCRWLLSFAAIALLAGCPAFVVDRGALVRPSATLALPAADQLPPASRYVELQEAWRRQTRIGVGGHATGVLIDPRLAAAQVAHQAALNSWRPAVTSAQLANTWDTYYGSERDRWPIDVEWRFDEQFIFSSRVLDPADWQFRLVTSEGRQLAPLAIAVLAREGESKDGYWDGKIRLWFPWRESGRLLLGGDTDWISLELVHKSGTGELAWRFGSVY